MNDQDAQRRKHARPDILISAFLERDRKKSVEKRRLRVDVRTPRLG
jgi:hypothetical protein